jgi:hypothetical protein
MFQAFIQYLISNNVPEYTILMLLYVPVIATLVTFARYFIGLIGLNIYSTILLTFALLELAHTEAGSFDVSRGLLYGILMTVSFSVVIAVLQKLVREFRMHYVAKVSIIMSLLSVVAFLMLYIATEFQAVNFMRLNPAAFVIMITMMDLFARTYVRKGEKKARILVANTIGLAFVIFTLMAQPFVRTGMLHYPEIVFYTIIVNIMVGQSRRLRLSEYLRFKDISIKPSNDPQHGTEQK